MKLRTSVEPKRYPCEDKVRQKKTSLVSLPIDHSISQLVGEFSQSVSQPFNRLISQRIHPVSQSVGQSVSHTISLSVRVVKEERLFRDVDKRSQQALQ